MQAGVRSYPVPPLPKQHLSKPGSKSDLKPQPLYDAPYYKGSEKLEGKVALITGGNSGIGRSVAVLFAAKGRTLPSLTSMSMTMQRKRSARWRKRGATASRFRAMSPIRSFANTRSNRRWLEFGKLDILVNNAAFQEHADDLEELSDEHFDQTLKTNLYGYFYMARAGVPHMENGGAIVMTGSVTGLLGSKDLLDYSMTKGGIHAFTRSLATTSSIAASASMRWLPARYEFP